MIVTVKPETRQGHFSLINDKGEKVGKGRARPSVNAPGYVTLIFSEVDSNADLRAMRVPTDWVSTLEALPHA